MNRKELTIHVLRNLLALTLIIAIVVTKVSVYAQDIETAKEGLVSEANQPATEQNTEIVSIETRDAGKGVVTIHNDEAFVSRLAVIVKRNDNMYFYTVSASVTNLPLQMGDGTYTITVYGNIDDISFKKITTSTIMVEGLRDEAVYTNSIQMADYEGYKDTIDKVNALLTSTQSDKEKVEAIYHYIISSLSYSPQKAENVKTDYLPDLRDFVATGEGICYDYASLFAAALRSNGIPTKLLMGYREDVEKYHAWNQVLIEGEWLTIDTSCDAQLIQAGIQVEMIKDSAIFSIKKVY